MALRSPPGGGPSPADLAAPPLRVSYAERVSRLVSDATYESLTRICGGGVAAVGRRAPAPAPGGGGPGETKGAAAAGDDDGRGGGGGGGGVRGDDPWLLRLRSLASESASFPNGGVPCPPPAYERGGDAAAAPGEDGGGGGDVAGRPHDVEVRAAAKLFYRYCAPTGEKKKKRRGRDKTASKKKGRKRRLSGRGGGAVGGAADGAVDGAVDGGFGEEKKSDDDDAGAAAAGGLERRGDADPADESAAGGEERRPPPPRLELISDMGLRRTVSSAAELAELLARDMEDALAMAAGDDSSAGVGGRGDGPGGAPEDDDDDVYHPRSLTQLLHSLRSDRVTSSVCLVTRPRAALLRSAGRLPCPRCVKWCRGAKGLWWHGMREHGADFGEASKEGRGMEENEGTMVVYDPNVARRGKGAAPGVRIRGTSSGRVPAECSKGASSDPFELAREGDLSALRALLASPSPPFDPRSHRDRNGASLLHWSAGSGHLPLVRYLIEERCCEADDPQEGKRGFGGRTALHWACRNGHLGVVSYLVEGIGEVGASEGRGGKGANLEARTADGTTAFCWAAWQGHVHIMRYLHSRGCDVHSVNSFGCNAALWSAQGNGGGGGGPGVGERSKRADGSDPDDGSKRATSSPPTSSLEALRWLRSVGCDLSRVNSNGHSVLHKCAQRGNADVCDWLLGDRARRLRRAGDSSPSPSSTSSQRQDDGRNDCVGALTLPLCRAEEVGLLSLLGPDLDGCSPSDLAGMGGYDGLAESLAEAEMGLASERWRSRTRSRDPVPGEGGGDDEDDDAAVPGWLSRSVDEARRLPRWRKAEAADPRRVEWEGGAGVRRMAARIALEEGEERDAKTKKAAGAEEGDV